MQTEHRDEVVYESFVKDKSILVGVITSHIVVRIEIDAECALEEWGYHLIYFEIKRQL